MQPRSMDRISGVFTRDLQTPFLPFPNGPFPWFSQCNTRQPWELGRTMRFFNFLLALAATATARRVVSVDISRATPEQRGLDRRAFSATLVNNKTAYFARVTVGTPPQPLTLHVDTGSSDLWVLAEGSDLCNSFRLQQEWGYCFDTFDAEQSSTFETVGRGEFAIRYVDGTGSAGDYFTDNVRLGDGVTITNLQMGLAHEATSNWGMLGIGYPAAVAAAEPYPNIIDLLLEQGHIPIKAYSLYLVSSRVRVSSQTITSG